VKWKDAGSVLGVSGEYNPSKRLVTFQSGAVGIVRSAAEPERFLDSMHYKSNGFQNQFVFYDFQLKESGRDFQSPNADPIAGQKQGHPTCFVSEQLG
jgi:hypothetical protein